MPTSPAELFRDWHDFYVLIGTASATLVGLMFVAASIGSTFFNEQNKAGLSAFLTPSVMHFGAVLFASLMVTIPTHSWQTLGVLIGTGGLAGSVYCGRILVQIIIRQRFKVDLSDRLFYALIPFLGYLVLSASGVFLLIRSASSANVIAAALSILLFAGIRNAWDMMLWIAIKAPTANGPPPPGEA